MSRLHAPAPPAPKEEKIRTSRLADLRNKADTFSSAGGFCCFFFAVALLVCVVAFASDEDHNLNTVFISGTDACMFFSLWLAFYVIAQLIHIRANTEK